MVVVRVKGSSVEMGEVSVTQALVSERKAKLTSVECGEHW